MQLSLVTAAVQETSVTDGMRPTCTDQAQRCHVLLGHNQTKQMMAGESCSAKDVLLDRKRDQQ